MALLDRLRPQPAWKHADPAVRIASLDTLPESELGVIATLARTDESPRVRRAAIARLTDADALGMIARGEVDAQVRADALARLLTLALDGTDIPRAALAARALREERALVQVARSAPDADIALAALDRLNEARAFGAVAKHSMHDAVRARALERLTDPAELEAVAITTEYNDTGVAAVDRLGESAAMDVIADRARNPVVARRARAFIRVRDQRAADARAKAEAGARRRALLTEGVDALEHVSDPTRARAELDRLESEFAALADDGGADDAARFAGRIAVQRARLDALEQAEADAAAERAARAAGIEAREALIARAAEDAADLDAHLAGLLSEWSALSSLAGGDDGSWTRRFAETGEQTRNRAAARARAAAVHDDVVALVGRIEALAAPDAALEESERAWPVLESEWKALTASLEIDAELSARVRRVADLFAERRRSRQADAAKVRDHRLETWKALAARAGAVAAQPDAPMRDVDQAVRDLKAVLEPQAGGSGSGESAKGAPPDAIAAELRTSLAALSTRLRELRDAEDWRRWANAGIQEALVSQVEALKSSKDLPNVARQLRDLRRQWKAVSVGRDESGALWQRFKSAADELQARCDEQARLVAAEQAVHLQARVALCESAEALAQSTDWVTTAETLKQLQAQWAAAGPAPRDQVAELARRFRTACDTFFTRRKTDLASLKQAWSENASKKEALCAQAEALAESTDWQAALTGIKQLQADWKAVGPVRRNRAELLWKRFRAACDKFFERYGSRHQIAEQQRVEQREGMVKQIEALAAEVAAGTLPENIAATVQDLWTQWQNGAGLSGEAGAALRARFDAALHAVVGAAGEAFAGSRFDVSAQVARRSALCDEVEIRRGRPVEAVRGRFVAGGDAGRAAARIARRQHHRRTRQRGRQAARRGGQGPAGAAAVARPRPGLRRGGRGTRIALPPRRAPLLRSPPRAAPRAVGRAAPGRSAASRRGDVPTARAAIAMVAGLADRPVGEAQGPTAARARHGPTAIRVRSAASSFQFPTSTPQNADRPAAAGLVGVGRWRAGVDVKAASDARRARVATQSVRRLFEVGVALQAVFVEAEHGAHLAVVDPAFADRGLDVGAELVHQPLDVELDVVEHLAHRVALHHLVDDDVVGAVEADVDGVGVAEAGCAGRRGSPGRRRPGTRRGSRRRR